MADLEKIFQEVEDVFLSFYKEEGKKCVKDGKVSTSLMDEDQLLWYDFSWGYALLQGIKEMVEYAKKGSSLEEMIARGFIGFSLKEIKARLPEEVGKRFSRDIEGFIEETQKESFHRELYKEIEERGSFGEYFLSEEQKMMQDTFREFAKEKVEPLAEKIHREDLTVPEEIISSLRELGCFGLSIPEEYGGFYSEESPDHVSMLVVTEELSKASLGAAGSLITRPEIVAKALLKGGTEDQKEKWLPLIASGEKMCAVAVTEPDFGSDVGGIRLSAEKKNGGWVLNGVKTWCTFAGRADILLVLARTDPDLSLRHKGLSLFIVEKPPSREHAFSYENPKGGKIEGKAIPTIGYRGMHSFEVVFEDFWVPEENLVGKEDGLGKGFYLQMEGFAGGRLQTAARALGVMQAALEKALSYAKERKVFGVPVINYGLTQWKISRMAYIIQGLRQLTYHAARLMDQGKGQMEASLVKFLSSRLAEWVTREAMQIHGGMGYAEEFAVSRYFVDARVLSIFEGAEEVLALRVIARNFLQSLL